MIPLIKNNAFLLVRKKYPLKKISRNDIIVFQSPLQKDFLLIKRVIGIPGDDIQILNTGIILINSQANQKLDSKKTENDSWIQFSWKLGNKEFIILGDNRAKSEDSRRFGPINFEHIIGRAIFNLTSLRFL